MAIDTRDKRAGVVSLALAFVVALPNANGDVSANDRAQTATAYSNHLLPAPATLYAPVGYGLPWQAYPTPDGTLEMTDLYHINNGYKLLAPSPSSFEDANSWWNDTTWKKPWWGAGWWPESTVNQRVARPETLVVGTRIYQPEVFRPLQDAYPVTLVVGTRIYQPTTSPDLFITPATLKTQSRVFGPTIYTEEFAYPVTLVMGTRIHQPRVHDSRDIWDDVNKDTPVWTEV